MTIKFWWHFIPGRVISYRSPILTVHIHRYPWISSIDFYGLVSVISIEIYGRDSWISMDMNTNQSKQSAASIWKGRIFYLFIRTLELNQFFVVEIINLFYWILARLPSAQPFLHNLGNFRLRNSASILLPFSSFTLSLSHTHTYLHRLMGTHIRHTRKDTDSHIRYPLTIKQSFLYIFTVL